jgi:pyruvate formate lyase activating enzyme
VFDIQRFSIHDGPGIRTTVFFKGCPLKCMWCANPESLNPFPEIMFNEARCTNCYRCVSVCPLGAIMQHSGTIFIDRKRCDGCGKCVDVCYSGALHLCGRYMSSEEVLNEVERDTPFYKTSNGGMTASGGEPLMQHEFLIEFFAGAHERGIYTALETSGYASWKIFGKVLKHIDLVLYDLKAVDPKSIKK